MMNDDDCRQQTKQHPISASFSHYFVSRSLFGTSCVVVSLQTQSNGRNNGTWEVNGSKSVHRRCRYHSLVTHDDGPAATAPSELEGRRCAVRLYR